MRTRAASSPTWDDQWWSSGGHSSPAGGPHHSVLNNIAVHCSDNWPGHGHCCRVEYGDMRAHCVCACMCVCVCVCVCVWEVVGGMWVRRHNVNL